MTAAEKAVVIVDNARRGCGASEAHESEGGACDQCQALHHPVKRQRPAVGSWMAVGGQLVTI